MLKGGGAMPRRARRTRYGWAILLLTLPACGSGSVEGVPGTDAGNRMEAAPGVDAPPPGPGASIAGCNVFPADNAWNAIVSALPLHSNAAPILAAMNPTRTLHPDWGNWSTDHYGIPWSSGTAAPP